MLDWTLASNRNDGGELVVPSVCVGAWRRAWRDWPIRTRASVITGTANNGSPNKCQRCGALALKSIGRANCQQLNEPETGQPLISTSIDVHLSDGTSDYVRQDPRKHDSMAVYGEEGTSWIYSVT